MFTYAHTFIDSIQSAKINTLKTLVTDENIRAPFQTIVEAETKFVKTMAEVADDFYSQFTDNFKKFMPKQ